MPTQQDRWTQHYKEILRFIRKNKRRPSKYIDEERQMVNWMKYNKKMIALEKIPADRVKKFNLLLAEAAKYRRLNQYVYAPTAAEEQHDVRQLSLF